MRQKNQDGREYISEDYMGRLFYLLALLLCLFTTVYFMDTMAATVRPVPDMTTAELLNGIYNTDGPSINVTLSATQVETVAGRLALVEGATLSFTATNITTSAYVDLHTLVTGAKTVGVVNNSGGGFYLRKNTTDLGYIAPGEASAIDMTLVAGDVVRIKSLSGTISSGNIYLNFFN